MKKLRRRKSERGQAIAELAASLIAISFVVLGLLAISILGMEGIKNLISARKGAEEYSAWNMAGESGGQHITEWRNVKDDEGQGDGFQFTRDDEPVTTTFPESENFTRELKDNTGMFSTSLLQNTTYSDAAFDGKFDKTNLFITAAGLTSSRSMDPNPLGKYQYFDLQRILNAFGVQGNFMVDDTVFLPSRGSNFN